MFENGTTKKGGMYVLRRSAYSRTLQRTHWPVRTMGLIGVDRSLLNSGTAAPAPLDVEIIPTTMNG